MPYNTTPQKISIRNIKRRTVFGFTVSSIIMTLGACFLLFITLGRIADKKESKLLECDAIAMSYTLDNYLKECESECTDVFVDETIINYDPAAEDPQLTEYEREQRKNEVKRQLTMISAGKCYNDFFIIYSNSETVGSVSQGVEDIASTMGYSAFSDVLGDKSDKWAFNTISGMKKFYYLRRLNDNAIFALSCYPSTLKTVLPPYRKGAAVNYILADENNIVITSDFADMDEGKIVPKKYRSLFRSDNEVVIDDYYIAAKVMQYNGWSVYAIAENSDFIPNYTVIITVVSIGFVIIVLLCLITGMIIFASSDESDTEITGSEYIDTITGTLNEYGLDEMISDMLETSLIGSTYAFIMIGIKDSEQIKSTVSLRYWNEIRICLAEKAEKFFEGRKHHLGRAYDDYIVVFVDYSEFDLFKAHNELRDGCEQLCRSFEDFTAGDDGTLKLGINIGASVYPDDGDDFDSLLGKARAAYKEAEKKEKNSFAIYKKTEDNEGKGDEK